MEKLKNGFAWVVAMSLLVIVVALLSWYAYIITSGLLTPDKKQAALKCETPWHHLVATTDKTGSATLYVNGVKLVSPLKGASHRSVGLWWQKGVKDWTNTINAFIVEKELSAKEVMAIYGASPDRGTVWYKGGPEDK